MKVFRRAETMQEKLVKDHPAVPDYRDGLAGTLTNIGVLLQGAGRPAEALKLTRRAVALRRQLLKEQPDSTTRHRT